MPRHKHEPDPNASAADILRQSPPAKRAALIRAAESEIVQLLESIHNAVGFPKDDGRWNSVLCLDLEGVRQRLLNPSRELSTEAMETLTMA